MEENEYNKDVQRGLQVCKCVTRFPQYATHREKWVAILAAIGRRQRRKEIQEKQTGQHTARICPHNATQGQHTEGSQQTR